MVCLNVRNKGEDEMVERDSLRVCARVRTSLRARMFNTIKLPPFSINSYSTLTRLRRFKFTFGKQDLELYKIMKKKSTSL